MNKQDKLKAENFAMKAEIIANDGIMNTESDLPPEIENQFLKNIIEYERAEETVIRDLIPEFPPENELTDEEVEKEFERLISELAKNHIIYGLPEELPKRVAYKYLTEEILDDTVKIPGFGGNWHIDGCSGWCPNCFVVDYCETVYEIWSPEELERERIRPRN